jgi:hypothetical protein
MMLRDGVQLVAIGLYTGHLLETLSAQIGTPRISDDSRSLYSCEYRSPARYLYPESTATVTTVCSARIREAS